MCMPTNLFKNLFKKRNIDSFSVRALNVCTCAFYSGNTVASVYVDGEKSKDSAAHVHACVSVTHMRAEAERSMYFLPGNVHIFSSGERVRPFRHVPLSRIS
jgi:hypothetical protein